MTQDEVARKVMNLGKYSFVSVTPKYERNRLLWEITALCNECGNIRHSTLKYFLAQDCGECVKLNRKRAAVRTWKERVKKIEKKYNFTCLDDVVSDRETLRWQCNECDTIRKKNAGNIWFNKQDLRCAKCHPPANKIEQEIKKVEVQILKIEKQQAALNKRIKECQEFVAWYIQNGYSFISCDKDGATLLHKKCGNIHRINFGDRHKHKYGCVACSKCGTSLGVERVEQWLNNHKVKYVREQRFETCKYKNMLPFDFFLPEFNALIEFNGEQHYRPCAIFGGIKKFELTQIRDDVKRKWAYAHGMKLIVIAWNDNVDKVLLKELKAG